MADLTERTVGYGFGLLGGLLMLLGAFVAMALGIVDLAGARPLAALAAWSETVILIVVGGLALFFAYMGQHAWKERSITSGLLLVVLAAIGWTVLGFGGNVIALVGALFVLLGGVLFLIEPTRRVIHTVATA
jgi:hypothetical protein